MKRFRGQPIVERHASGPSNAGVPFEALVAAAEEAVANDPNQPLSRWFAAWPLDAYAQLYLTDLSDYPALRARLPIMPSAAAQQQWTGNQGPELMRQSVAFAQGVEAAFKRHAGRPLLGATALDYGAGWGRLTRLFLRLIPDDQLVAADPWAKSAELFDTLGFRQNCVVVAPEPNELPWAPATFDLAWAFSVLTHLPEHVADAVMVALRPVLKADGLLAITVRPSAYWDAQDEPNLLAEHQRRGFAHRPGGDQWGDTSMTVDYIAARWPGWEVLGSETRALDPLQLVVYLRGR